MQRSDNLYYRNITTQKCCQYHQIKNYNSCSDAEVAKTASPSRADYKKPKESFTENYEKNTGPLSDETKMQIIIQNYNNKTPQLFQLLAIFTKTPAVPASPWDTLSDLKNLLFDKQYQYLVSCLSTSSPQSTMMPMMMASPQQQTMMPMMMASPQQQPTMMPMMMASPQQPTMTPMVSPVIPQ